MDQSTWFRFDEGEGRFFVGGDPIEQGDRLELELESGDWVSAFFSGGREGVGLFVIALGGGGLARLEVCSGTSMRWRFREAA